MEFIALYYQYILEFYPCSLCVQIRAWIVGVIILSTINSFITRYRCISWINLTLIILLLAGAIYTSWYAWEVEKGTIVSSCAFGAGFPEFMLLDEWIPWLFEATGDCGQSPAMWLGFSMVEWLLITLSIPFIMLVLIWFAYLKSALTAKN